jgi:hypothetical protein
LGDEIMDVIIVIPIIAMLGLAFIIFALVLTRGGREDSSQRRDHSFSDSFWLWFDGNSGGSSDTTQHHPSHHGSPHHDASAGAGSHHGAVSDFGSHHGGHGGFDGGGHSAGGGHH